MKFLFKWTFIFLLLLPFFVQTEDKVGNSNVQKNPVAGTIESKKDVTIDATELQEGGNELKLKTFFPSYIYDSGDKPDPFTLPAGIEDIGLTTPESERLHPVESDSIDLLKLQAILWSDGRDGMISRVLIQTTDGKTYTLTENDRLGREQAVLYRIDQDRIWFMQPYLDPNTGLMGYRPYEKMLAQSQGTSNKHPNSLVFER